jgi:hypothetical protein
MNLQDIGRNILSQSDDALIEMIINRSEYTIESIKIAEEEIERRNFDASYLENMQERLNAKKNEEEDLTGKEKIILIFSIFYIIIKFLGLENIFPTLPSISEYHHQGKIRKSKKTLMYKLFSTAFWIIVFIISWLIYDSYSANQRYLKYMNNQSANQLLHRASQTALVR